MFRISLLPRKENRFFDLGLMLTLKDERHVFLFSICPEGTGIEGMDGVSLVVEAASDIGPQER
jgi:hypothetical protein